MNNSFFEYKGYKLQQKESCIKLIEDFIKETKPARILEIGTSYGGFTYLLHTLTNVPIITVDIELKNVKVNEYATFYQTDIFDKLFLKDIIIPYISGEGRTIIFCDGGNKAKEFNSFSYLIKENDIILAHDYFYDIQSFNTDLEWDWCEITEESIKTASFENNLIPIHTELLNINWVCKVKNSKNQTKKLL